MSKFVQILGTLLIDALLFTLVAGGIGGLVYAMFGSDNGQLVYWLKEGWEKAPGFLALILAAAVVLFFLFKPWLDNLDLKERAGNLLMHAWVILGLLFGLHWLSAVSFS